MPEGPQVAVRLGPPNGTGSWSLRVLCPAVREPFAPRRGCCVPRRRPATCWCVCDSIIRVVEWVRGNISSTTFGIPRLLPSRRICYVLRSTPFSSKAQATEISPSSSENHRRSRKKKLQKKKKSHENLSHADVLRWTCGTEPGWTMGHPCRPRPPPPLSLSSSARAPRRAACLLRR